MPLIATTMSSNTLSAKYLLSLVRHLEQEGLGEDVLQQVLGTDVAELENAVANGQQIPLSLYGKCYRFYLQAVAGENFGFPGEIGDMTGRYRMLYLMMVNSRDLGVALAKLDEFYKTFALSSQLINIDSSEDGQLHFDMNFLMQTQFRRQGQEAAIIANLLTSFHRILCWLTGLPLALRRVEISGRPPLHPENYRQLFDSEVLFNRPLTRLTYPQDVVTLGIVQNEQSLNQFLQQFPESLFNSPQPTQQSLSERVQQVIGHNFKRRLPSQLQLAQLLEVSEKELKASLKLEGKSYNQLIESTRQAQAYQLLSESELDLNSIAEQLGFPATSAFHRSFKRWTGMTPGEYRKQQLG